MPVWFVLEASRAQVAACEKGKGPNSPHFPAKNEGSRQPSKTHCHVTREKTHSVRRSRRGSRARLEMVSFCRTGAVRAGGGPPSGASSIGLRASGSTGDGGCPAIARAAGASRHRAPGPPLATTGGRARVRRVQRLDVAVSCRGGRGPEGPGRRGGRSRGGTEKGIFDSDAGQSRTGTGSRRSGDDPPAVAGRNPWQAGNTG